MATLASGAEKYAMKAGSMGANYEASMSRFFGRPVGNSLPVRNFKSAIKPETAQKWARNLSAAFGV